LEIDMMERSRVWMDVETQGLHRQRRAWEIAAIVRPHDGTRADDIEFSCFVDIADLDLSNAEPDALAIGRFWERHPQAHLVPLVGTLLGVERELPAVPPAGAVRREWEALSTLADLTKGAIIHGSNPAFDVETLSPRMAVSRLEPGWHYHPEDTPGVARGWLLGRGHRDVPRKSDQVSALCGIDPTRYDRHTALGDCRWTRDLTDLIEQPEATPDVADGAGQLRHQLAEVAQIAGQSHLYDEDAHHASCPGCRIFAVIGVEEYAAYNAGAGAFAAAVREASR
jgi:hypothetical protein